MRRLFLIFTMALICGFAYGQAKDKKNSVTPEKQAVEMVNHLNISLKLTAKQQADMKKWFTETYKKKNVDLKKAANPAAKSDVNKEVNKKVREYLKNTLTAEQYKLYQDGKQKKEGDARGADKKGNKPQQKNKKGKK